MGSKIVLRNILYSNHHRCGCMVSECIEASFHRCLFPALVGGCSQLVEVGCLFSQIGIDDRCVSRLRTYAQMRLPSRDQKVEVRDPSSYVWPDLKKSGHRTALDPDRMPDTRSTSLLLLCLSIQHSGASCGMHHRLGGMGVHRQTNCHVWLPRKIPTCQVHQWLNTAQMQHMNAG